MFKTLLLLPCLLFQGCDSREPTPARHHMRDYPRHSHPDETINSLDRSLDSLDRTIANLALMQEDIDRMNYNLDQIFRAVSGCETDVECVAEKERLYEQSKELTK